MDAIAYVMFGGRYSIKRHCIYLIPHRRFCRSAEVFFTRIKQAFIVNGLGFTFYPAGLSNRVLYAKGKWRGFWHHMIEHTDFRKYRDDDAKKRARAPSSSLSRQYTLDPASHEPQSSPTEATTGSPQLDLYWGQYNQLPRRATVRDQVPARRRSNAASQPLYSRRQLSQLQSANKDVRR